MTMPTTRHLRLLTRAARIGLFWVVLAFYAVAAAGANASPAFYDGISSDGQVAVFSTKEQMVPGDTDQEEDVYVRAIDTGLGEYVTREVSIGPKGGNDTLPAHYDGISGDGTEVFFSTQEPMVAEDHDHREDIYVRNLVENRTLLVSQPDVSCAIPNCGNNEVDSNFVPGGVAKDGGRAYFGTTERLSGEDEDSTFDLYVRDVEAETTTLVSVHDGTCGACGNEGQAALYWGTDDAGDKAFFTTTERLTTADTDSGRADIYEHDLDTGTTSLVSTPGTCPSDLLPENCEPSFGGASPDGSHVFFETNEQISNEDTDSFQDVYDWSGGGQAALASIGSGGTGNGDFIDTYAGSSSDGGTVYFQTEERLDTTADTDHSPDVYQRSGGITTLVSAGAGGKGNEEVPASFEWASTAGGTPVVVFSTTEALTTEDTDSAQDVYERSGGVTTLVSTGPQDSGGPLGASFAGASADGSKIFFATAEPLVSADTDSSNDIYMRSAAGTVLVSVGPAGGNGPFPAGLHDSVSSDGSRAYFVTLERLTEGDDYAGEADVYGWSGSGTLLVSVKNSPDLVLGPPPPALERTSPVSPNVSTSPAIVGQGAAGALIKVYSTFDCSGEPVAQGTAEELASPGLTVAVPVAVGSTTKYRATAEVEGIVSICSGSVTYKQENPLPPPPPPTEGGGGGTGSGGGGIGPKGGGKGGSGGTSSGVTRGGVTYFAPLTRITFGPAAKTRLRRPTFRFVDSTEQPGTRFFCKIDRKHWRGCSSPTKVKKLGLGRHVFSVKAVNAVGIAGPAPVKRAFKVVH
jgi:hypothetical protein